MKGEGTGERAERAWAQTGLRPWEWLVLALFLVAEFRLCTGFLDKFFDHDSLFYLINHPRSWRQFAILLTAPDVSQQYRPMTLGLMALVVPALGTDPRSYHWIPVLFHMLNTILLYLLCRRLMGNAWSGLAAAGFWAFHSVAGWVTSGIAFISDFIMVFFLLSSALMVLRARTLKSIGWMAASVAAYGCAVLSKEAAVTAPAVVVVCLVLFEIGEGGIANGRSRLTAALRRVLRPAAPFLLVSLLHVGVLSCWFQAGRLYNQAAEPAYAVDPIANLGTKSVYLYWALNLPEALRVGNASRKRVLALVLMSAVLMGWAWDLLRRKLRLTPVEMGGMVWFGLTSIPMLMLSQRTAKWYLYLPLAGLALMMGTSVGRLEEAARRRSRFSAGIVLLALLLIPVVYSSSVQTRSLLAVSDSSYQSDILAAALQDLRRSDPRLPPQAVLYFLPSFDQDVLRLLSAKPIDHGELFGLFYPGSEVQAKFAHRGDELPEDYANRADVRILYSLGGRLHDVTDFYRSSGCLSLYLLPTLETRTPPLMEKEPLGGWQLHGRHVRCMFGDRGDPLPRDYVDRPDLWIVQYIMGHFHDVTAYYKGRRADSAIRLIKSISDVRASVSRGEIYPDYERFATPTGAPAFFLTPGSEILTLIGGCTGVVGLPAMPAGARLRFDVAWVYDSGDGGWAEVKLRKGDSETTLFKEYMDPNRGGRGFEWKEVAVGMPPPSQGGAVLVLKCYNDPGKNTVSDWLAWRDIVIEMPNAPPTR